MTTSVIPPELEIGATGSTRAAVAAASEEASPDVARNLYTKRELLARGVEAMKMVSSNKRHHMHTRGRNVSSGNISAAIPLDGREKIPNEDR